MTKLFIDFETRSAVDIKTAGAWKYAMDPSTEVLCMAVSDGHAPLCLYGNNLFGEPSFFSLKAAETLFLVAHNAHFEYAIYHCILHKRFGWPALWDPKHWACTMSRAAAANLPLSLDACGKALGIDKKKDTEGRSVMLKLCKPSSIDPLGSPIYNNDPALFQKLYDYCKRDVEAEMELDRLLPELSKEERKVWELDLIINRRGIAADVEAAAKAKDLASSLTDKLNGKLTEITGGEVDKASRVGALKTYLAKNGVNVDSMDKASVSVILSAPQISQNLKDVVKIRQQVGKSSTAKYSAILDVAANHDNRLRGLLQYHAAGTGRWGGRLVQPQNFPKGIGFDSERVVEDVLTLNIKGFDEKYGDKSMDALSAGLRAVLMAGPGKTLVSADYASIEARVLLWLADDPFALAKYRMGVDLYLDMAKSVYNNDSLTKENKLERNVGKFLVLGCGYGLGAKKMLLMCQQQGIDVTETLAEAAVKAYRTKYKKVVDLWYSVEQAARSAVRAAATGSSYTCCTWADPKTGKSKGFRVVWTVDAERRFLVCQLPSGRRLRYYRPSLKTINTPFGEKEEIHYWAAGLGGKLEECKTYGGSLVENIVQGTARDIMANGMINAEAAGFPVVLTVHDELVTEKVGAEGDVDGLIKAMCDLPDWAEGCPIEAEGWTGKRYRK